MYKTRSIIEFYDSKDKYLFLGNGINLLSTGDCWGDLLLKICDKTNTKINFEGKTYPLLFEEIAFNIRKKSHVEHNIDRLKSIISEICFKYSPNDFHEKIIKTNYYSNFITTNYDYNIEKTLSGNFDSVKDKNKKNPKYSLNRYNKVSGFKVWHIHGEIDNGLRGIVKSRTESIMIGNEHYGDNHKRVHELLKGEKGLYHLMKNSNENWVHLLLSRDIDILGFGMDFNEFHLWFILNYRARMKRKGTSIGNKIRWFIPEFSWIDNKAKIELLKTLDVEVYSVETKEKNYHEFYTNFLKALN